MASNKPIHVISAEGGVWAVQDQNSASSSIHASRSLAVAKAWEIVESRPEGEIIVHEQDGSVHSNLLIRRSEQGGMDPDFLEEAEEESLRQEAMRITPNRAELHELIRRMPVSSIDYSREDDELPC